MLLIFLSSLFKSMCIPFPKWKYLKSGAKINIYALSYTFQVFPFWLGIFNSYLKAQNCMSALILLSAFPSVLVPGSWLFWVFLLKFWLWMNVEQNSFKITAFHPWVEVWWSSWWNVGLTKVVWVYKEMWVGFMYFHAERFALSVYRPSLELDIRISILRRTKRWCTRYPASDSGK